MTVLGSRELGIGIRDADSMIWPGPISYIVATSRLRFGNQFASKTDINAANKASRNNEAKQKFSEGTNRTRGSCHATFHRREAAGKPRGGRMDTPRMLSPGVGGPW